MKVDRLRYCFFVSTVMVAIELFDQCKDMFTTDIAFLQHGLDRALVAGGKY